VTKGDSANVIESIRITRLDTTLDLGLDMGIADASVVLRDKDFRRSAGRSNSGSAELGDAKPVQQEDMSFSSIALRSS